MPLESEEKKRIAIVVICMISGIFYTAHVLKERSGELGTNEIMALGFTALVGAIILILIVRNMSSK